MPEKEKRIAIRLMLVLSFLLLASSCLGYDNLGNSARATGMGNAFVGLADDPSAIFYNPAGLSQLKAWHVSFLYDKKSKYGLTDTENPFLASGVVAFPIRENLCIGVSGCQNGSWSDPTQVVTNNVGQLSLSAQVDHQISVGFSGKFLYNSNFGKKKGADFDLGILYYPIENFSLGIAGENLLATDMRPDIADRSSSSGYATRKGKLGLSFVRDDRDFFTTIALDLVLKDIRQPIKRTYAQESFGIEQWIFNRKEMSFAFRGGYTFGKDYELDYRQPSFGLGARYRGKEMIVQVDYSWQKYPYHPPKGFTGDHRISLTFSPSLGKGPLEAVKRESKPTSKEARKVERWREPIDSDSHLLKFDLDSRVEDVSSEGNRLVVFLLRPRVDFDVSEWRLHICHAKPPGWNQAEIEPYHVEIIKGRGMPGFGVVWDLEYKGKEVQRGHYFYSLLLVDTKGQRWHSDWRSFEAK